MSVHPPAVWVSVVIPAVDAASPSVVGTQSDVQAVPASASQRIEYQRFPVTDLLPDDRFPETWPDQSKSPPLHHAPSGSSSTWWIKASSCVGVIIQQHHGEFQTARPVIADVGVERPTVVPPLSISAVIRIVICAPKILGFRIKSPGVIIVYSGPFLGQGQDVQKPERRYQVPLS